MGWVYLDDKFPTHPKIALAGGDAGWLFVCGLAWVKEHATEGRIPKAFVPQLSDRRSPMVLARRLEEVGLWVDADDHYEIHDYHEWNKPGEARTAAAKKAARARWSKASDANAMPNAMPTHSEGTAETPASPCPSPLPPSPSSNYSSSSSSVEVDEDDRIEAAIGILADRDLDARLADVDRAGPVRSTDAWRSSAAAKRRANDRTRLLELAKDRTLTADDLADALTRPAAPAKEEPVNTSAHIPRFVPEVVPKVSDEERRKMAADMAAMRANGLKHEAAS